MTVNPYTMNMLYQKGILDYVPQDLMISTPIPVFGDVSNPYLNSAMQGNLYQQYGTMGDSFTSSANAGGGYYNTQIGANSNISTNRFFGNGATGSSFQNGLRSMFGFNGNGCQSDSGVTMFGESGIGGNSNINMGNTYGGFEDVKNNLSTGFNKTISTVTGLPTVTKGLIAAGILVLTLCGMFKGGKKPPKTSSTGFWSKLFKKSKPAPPPKKLTTWEKIKNWFKK